jgi:flagellar basal-body rod modification protein FlgD
MPVNFSNTTQNTSAPINALDKAPAKADTGMLDKDGFLKLFVAQLQHQDPMNAQDAGQSMEQMAQFSMVEQITNLAKQNTEIAKTLSTSSAVGLIGRTVTYTGMDGESYTGKVEQVATSKDGKSTLTVAGTAGVDPTSLTQVA